MLLKLAVDLGIEGFAGGGSVANRGKVETGEVLLNEHTVHSRRRAESGNLIFCKHGQNLLCIKAVKVVDKVCRLTQPLAVELAPQGFCPARIGNGQVQTLGVYPVPVFCGNEMAQGVLIVMGRDFRIAGGAGGKEHQHGV